MCRWAATTWLWVACEPPSRARSGHVRWQVDCLAGGKLVEGAWDSFGQLRTIAGALLFSNASTVAGRSAAARAW